MDFDRRQLALSGLFFGAVVALALMMPARPRTSMGPRPDSSLARRPIPNKIPAEEGITAAADGGPVPRADAPAEIYTTRAGMTRVAEVPPPGEAAPAGKGRPGRNGPSASLGGPEGAGANTGARWTPEDQIPMPPAAPDRAAAAKAAPASQAPSSQASAKSGATDLVSDLRSGGIVSDRRGLQRTADLISAARHLQLGKQGTESLGSNPSGSTGGGIGGGGGGGLGGGGSSKGGSGGPGAPTAQGKPVDGQGKPVTAEAQDKALGDGIPGDIKVDPVTKQPIGGESDVNVPRNEAGIPSNAPAQAAPTNGPPIWAPFLTKFNECKPSPECVPTQFGIERQGDALCHGQSKAIDLHAMKCGGTLHRAIDNAKFADLVGCMRRPGASGPIFGIWHQCFRNCQPSNPTNHHLDHVHLSIGCPGPPW